ncbi:trafficking kinesin-binding protein 1 [Cricetulus griseus]|uniref:Trafficking kinesin-binding protein 1 n=1 Tax=Cricetulus griseus TaxID=10029 RepID=A0A061I1E2_CRIGR|nr:trafficking kinesin-binding protein 1 [Cricetulus griseus]
MRPPLSSVLSFICLTNAEVHSYVCNSTNLPEVEIISLLEEQLPHYKLRADTIYGYDHDDWLHTPLISPDANIDLTTEQIEETLKYFLLCAERVGQMTKTYNDIDAVTRLLEECSLTHRLQCSLHWGLASVLVEISGSGGAKAVRNGIRSVGTESGK